MKLNSLENIKSIYIKFGCKNVWNKFGDDWQIKEIIIFQNREKCKTYLNVMHLFKNSTNLSWK